MKHNCNSKKLSSFDQFFGNVFGELENVFGRDMDPIIHSTIPNTNILETENHFALEISAPGRSKNDFNISLDKDTLTISSNDETKEEKIDGKYHKREFKLSQLKRSFIVPENVDTEKISAKYLNGVLIVKLPKTEKVELSKKIEIG